MGEGGGEDRLLRWLWRQLDRHHASPRRPRRQPSRQAPGGGAPLIGDDAAILPGGGPFAVTVDSQIAGVHFVPGLDAAVIARRLLAVNLSDLAAMGAVPTYAFLALTAPPGFDHRRFFRALLEACARHRLRLAGGDLSRGPESARGTSARDRASAAGPAVIATLTLIGRHRRGARWLRRAGAAPGHHLWLGGTIGESAAGRLLIGAGARLAGERVFLPEGWDPRRTLGAAARRAVRRHLLPQPQLALGKWLATQKAGAAIDVSDGVARDLHRLCGASGVGARIEAAELPLAPGFAALCAALAADPEQLALGGGEDYVLLFTLPAGSEPPARCGCRRIGTITSRRRVLLIADGEAAELPVAGWDHLEQVEDA
ncbi:MAG TPA: thiamine-phosphate kinase [Thermoanaerobaculia bacterium]|nr:thiamine-phosphate kinase [Thermoanaerobaculia bacterium]